MRWLLTVPHLPAGAAGVVYMLVGMTGPGSRIAVSAGVPLVAERRRRRVHAVDQCAGFDRRGAGRALPGIILLPLFGLADAMLLLAAVKAAECAACSAPGGWRAARRRICREETWMETNQNPEHMSGLRAESLLKREPVYEGFRRARVKLSCLSCGHVFGSEAEVPFKQKHAPSVFSREDAAAPVKIFQGEGGPPLPPLRGLRGQSLCPALRPAGKIVEATDSCEFFQRLQPADESGAKPAPKIKL